MLNNRRKIYQVGGPYFSSKDINWILKKAKQVLKGKLSTGPFCLEFVSHFATLSCLFFAPDSSLAGPAECAKR